MTALLKYDAACRAVAEAKTIDEVRSWIDKAAAVREYARRIKDRQLELNALEIRAISKRRRGELILELKAEGHFPEGRRTTVDSDPQFKPWRLEDFDISRDESSEEQEIAKLDGTSFDRLVARCRAYAESHPEKHSINVLKPPPDGPINGARSIMGSRQEPDDSLDYFPTPPWATRALIESVLHPHLGVEPLRSAWEPACGEGHIAEVLREYFGRVIATDIFDYGYGDNGPTSIDFLSDREKADAEWIITNPPFGDKTEQFVLRSIERARVGVAMFVRMQWLETIGRYERVFKDNPPTLIAFFAERVNLCKGEWKPDGGTATAYIWLVWIRGTQPRAPIWIPPGRQDELTHDDDAERFTAHPVIKRIAPKDSNGSPIPHNENGEVTDSDSNSREGSEDDSVIGHRGASP